MDASGFFKVRQLYLCRTGIVFCNYTAILLSIQRIHHLITMTKNQTKTEALILEDKGSIPNSLFPLLIYRNAFSKRGNNGAEWLENIFASNQWNNSWRWRIYDFHHYHSNTHEVLGVFKDSAMLLMGGEGGKIFTVNTGEIIIIPAGVGHKCLES